MDIHKLFNKKKYNFGDLISLLIEDLYKEYKYKNILFIRTCTTGSWLDNLLLENKNINRILYYTDKKKNPTTSHKLTQIIYSNELENTLMALNKTFDLICMDTWHEYEVSSSDFRIISSFLNESGILISHDCYPWNKEVANPLYVSGNWCGETYLAFINFAYNNPDMFYTILNIDTGIGILSKKKMMYLSNTLDRKKQEYLLLLHKNSQVPYTYFIENSKDIINSISFYTF
jgi:hypothetical protein